MTTDLLQKFEQKVAHAVEVIELLRMQIEELETENTLLKAEHDKWRKDLMSLISRFDQIEEKAPRAMSITREEEFMTV